MVGVGGFVVRRTRRRAMQNLRDRVPTPFRRQPAAPVTQAIPTVFWVIVSAVAALCGIGLVFVLSATSVMAAKNGSSSWYSFGRQSLWLAAGIVAAFVLSRFNYRTLLRLSPMFIVGSFFMLLLVLLPTPLRHEVNGSRRWFGFGQIQVQPSELAKISVILFVANVLDRRAKVRSDPKLTVVPVLFVTCVTSALVLVEPDLGTSVLIASTAIVMLVVAGCRLDAIARWTLPIAAVGVLSTMWGYRRQRMLAFTDPWKYGNQAGFQTLQSQVGLATGGLFGVGLGNSRAKWGFLPEAHTDFIFAIIGEELGLVGCVAVIALFGVLIGAGCMVALRSPDRAGTLIASGITAWIGIQAAINIGVSVGVLPNKGMTLPFVSYGGSSLTVTMAGVGILLSVARRSVSTKPAGRSRSGSSTSTSGASAKGAKSAATRPMKPVAVS